MDARPEAAAAAGNQETAAGMMLPAAVPRPDTARIGLGGVTGLIIRPVTPPAKGVSLVLCLCLGLEFVLEFSFLLEFLLEFSFG